MIRRIDLPAFGDESREVESSWAEVPVLPQADAGPPARPWRDLFLGHGPLWLRLLAWASRNTRG